MKFIYLLLLITFSFSLIAQENHVIKPITVDKDALSGLGMKAVKNKDQPNRRLFQKNIFWGKEIGVFVVSSETASARQDNYSMEEFLYLLNGRSRMKPDNGPEVIFKAGDYFIAPKGFTGEWETQGGNEFILELSVIATERPEVSVESDRTLPQLLSRDILSGYGIPEIKNGKSAIVKLYSGLELTAEVEVFENGIHFVNENAKEQLLQVLSGKLVITDVEGEEYHYYTGDWLVLPSGFKGEMDVQAHGKFRVLRIVRSPIIR